MKLKKVLVLCLAMILACTALTFVACEEENKEPATVMNVSLNPEVEFVLDVNGKVLTVNALNEEGNLVISAEAFDKVEGKTAEEAAQLFVQVAKDTGYLVSGSIKDGENEIDISISGDTATADKIYNDVKTKVDSYLSQENITATLNKAEAITKAELEKLVAECAPYLEEAEIKAMEYKELLATIAESRKETAEYYSQELKNAYYEAKAFCLDQAKYEALKSQLNSVAQIAFDAANNMYVSACETLENTRKATLVDENSAYQKALADVRAKKTEYLNYRNEVSQMEQSAITSIVTAHLDMLKQALDTAEQALLAAGKAANQTLDSIKATLTTAHNSVTALLKDLNTDAFVDDIAAKQTQAFDTFFTQFESDYASAKTAAETNWNAMEEALKKGYEETK